MTFNEADVLIYLKEKPEFLSSHAKELNIALKDDKFYSFLEAKNIAQQKKIDELVLLYDELLQNADENQKKLVKLYHLTLALLDCRTLMDLYDVLRDNLSSQFNLSYFALKILESDENDIDIPSAFKLLSQEKCYKIISQFKETKCGNFCIHNDLYSWFQNTPNLESFLHLPLIAEERVLGILLIGHEKSDYFSENLSTDYIDMIGKFLSVTINRIKANHRKS